MTLEKAGSDQTCEYLCEFKDLSSNYPYSSVQIYTTFRASRAWRLGFLEFKLAPLSSDKHGPVLSECSLAAEVAIATVLRTQAYPAP
jgi:hypothetical protein